MLRVDLNLGLSLDDQSITVAASCAAESIIISNILFTTAHSHSINQCSQLAFFLSFCVHSHTLKVTGRSTVVPPTLDRVCIRSRHRVSVSRASNFVHYSRRRRRQRSQRFCRSVHVSKSAANNKPRFYRCDVMGWENVVPLKDIQLTAAAATRLQFRFVAWWLCVCAVAANTMSFVLVVCVHNT